MLRVSTAFALSVGVIAAIATLGALMERDGAEASGLRSDAGIAAAGVISGPARVIDGDTVEIAGTRIRIQGIDAPELDDRCHRPDGSEWACGVWSAEAARDRFGGQTLRCEDLGERSWGRVVARCLMGETDMAAAMVAKGAARACPRFAQQHAHSRPYMEIERAAVAQRRGIFDSAPPPLAGFCRTSRSVQAPDPDLGVRPIPAAARGDCAIKGNINARGERIYHLPGQQFYDVTRIDESAGQRWFCSEAEARAAGWRPALR